MNYKYKRKKIIDNYIFISQVVFFLLLGILILRVYNFSYETFYTDSLQVFIFIILLSLIPFIKILNYNSKFKPIYIDTIVIFLYLIIVCYFITIEKESIFKIILLMPVVVISIKYGLRPSFLAAFVSSLALITISLVNSNISFDADIMLSGVLFLLAWLLGNMTETEAKIREELERLATHDGLTDLLNHRSFQSILDEKITEAKRKKSSLSLLLLDIDYFKVYNDSLGHQKGDIVLKTVADIMKNATEGKGYCARYGGEEFVIILPETSIHEARKLADTIREQIEKTEFIGMQVLPKGKVTVSIGIAQLPLMADTKEKLIQKADEALYKAKFVSKNKVEVYYSVFDELSLILKDEEQELLNSIRTLTTVINAKDRYTYGHSERTMELCRNYSRLLKFDDFLTKNLIYGSLLHDIGKIEISREVLNKPKKLNQSEWEMFKQHPQWGADIIRPIKTLQDSLEIILYHHENYDGTGYPKGLKGKDIPIGARILRIVDSYDAITTKRPYKEAMSKEQAVEELAKYSGTHYDPIILEQFCEMILKKDDV
ncbi:MAG: hypothetical protein VR72_12060 [Clostridiaceae bacterium BRH_c20a]|nr:MAG: hypothetical protein VR72_12060 [Clostridiaceae bacterium BRH_c20a]